MNLYKQKEVFNIDIFRPGKYIAFGKYWTDEGYAIGIIVDSSEIEIRVAVYDEFSKNENKLDIHTLKLDCNYDIMMPNITLE